MSEYFIPLLLQYFLDDFALALFTLATVLCLLVLYCLIKLKNFLHSALRKYLIYIQVLIFLADFHMHILFDGFPLFPILAGYCNGLLCGTQLPGIFILFTGNVFVAIVMCLIYRHQSIILAGHRLKFNPPLSVFPTYCLLVFLSQPGCTIDFV
ncbi:hypothetical protein PENTCL1PPCAC_3808, partial [Pristionchus entomophagus]